MVRALEVPDPRSLLPSSTNKMWWPALGIKRCSIHRSGKTLGEAEISFSRQTELNGNRFYGVGDLRKLRERIASGKQSSVSRRAILFLSFTPFNNYFSKERRENEGSANS